MDKNQFIDQRIKTMENIRQMIEDNCMTCEHCKYSELALNKETLWCTLFDDFYKSENDYCNYFEDKEPMSRMTKEYKEWLERREQ